MTVFDADEGLATAIRREAVVRPPSLALQRASPSLALRRFRRRVRRVLLTPLSRWIARDPETVVRVPALDAAFVSALKLIAPQYESLEADEASRLFWERAQNSACLAEDAALGSLLRAMPPPARILEIGPGLGRSVVFFARRYFPHARFDVYDATGHAARYELDGSRHEDSFCGNLDVLRRCLEFNQIGGFRIIDASATGGHIPPSREKYDFIYSFYAVGFHWSVDHWLDEILGACRDTTLCVLMVPSHFEPSLRIRAMPYTILEGWAPTYPEPWGTVYFLVFTPKRVPWLAV
jgi:hypothetical protein